AVGQGELAADGRLDAAIRRGPGQPGGAVDTVAIEQGDSGHAEARGFGGERLGMLGTFEEREGRLRVELDEHGSVVEAVEIPVAGEAIAGEPTERAVGEHHVPLVARPRLPIPPLTRRSPRTRRGDDEPCLHARRTLPRRLDLYAPRRPHPPQREPLPPLSGRGLEDVVLSWNSLSTSTISRGGLSRRREREHREGIGTVRVDEHRRSQIVGADEGGEAREHGDEIAGSGRGRLREPSLPGLRPDRMSADRTTDHGGGG